MGTGTLFCNLFEVVTKCQEEQGNKVQTGIYHVIMRGINRQSIFEDNEDRQKLIETFADIEK